MYKIQVREAIGYAERDPSGRYSRFRDVLGKGAMKTVYRAFDEVLGMEVAWNQVKLNDVFRSPEELHRLYSEVHLLKNLDHESIIKFYASWIDVERRTFNFITEMFTSGTLREYRQRYERVDIRAVKNWARQILRGIVYLHDHDPPVIHRDLKCDNIFVNGHLGQVKIGDLGLAAILRDSQQAHSVIGTPEFMAPELYEEEYNELVDVYSFGMCMLEMLTSEYPYSECSNPAQIYKKVTSGKLPKAYHRIEDLEAREFVGKCLENVSKRPSARDLLMDPFLATNEAEVLPIPRVPIQESDPDETVAELPADPAERNTDMIITGSMKPGVENTIFLRVHLSNLGGRARNVYFPFCTQSDTPIDVAMEMVSELDIIEWDPYVIAGMIEEEVLYLVPDWNYAQRSSFSFLEDEYDGTNHPFDAASSSSSSRETQFLRENIAVPDQAWLLEGLFALDDASSNANYSSGDDEDEYDPTPRGLKEPVATTRNHNSTRFCPTESASAKQDKINRNLLGDSRDHRSCDHRSNDVVGRKITRMRSMMDVRSQLLHRSLVEEISKRRLFNTVGSVENIGFQEPCGSRGHEKVRYKW